jgi:hypothetical protein
LRIRIELIEWSIFNKGHNPNYLIACIHFVKGIIIIIKNFDKYV